MLKTLLDRADTTFEPALNAWLQARRPGASDPALRDRVAEILAAVRDEGDEALLRLSRELDGRQAADVEDLEVPTERVWAAVEQADPDVVLALEEAHERLERYHQGLLPEARHPLGADGPAYQRVLPVDRAGVYVPGGRAAYPSSVLMTAVPARVAGVDEVIMVSPAPGGEIPEAVLAAAAIAGVDRVFRLGGAHAIAALAFGTASVPRVDVIVGPGNAWVAEAKRQVFGLVGIDMVAGPSEILVALSDPAHADLAAADLLAQAEHDPQAIPMLLVPSRALLQEVTARIEARLESLPRKKIVRASLRGRGLGIVEPALDAWPALCDRLAPEHLELLGADAEAMASALRFAGALFVGPFSPEALGDYCAGPDHVLPTAGTARFASPLGPEDFMRRMSVLRFPRAEAEALRSIVTTLARAEGLEAHARSMEARFE